MAELDILQKEQDIATVEEKIKKLEDLVESTNVISYNPDCVRKKSNWSKPSSSFKFDHEEFNPELITQNLEKYSPKLYTLLNKIKELDEKDKKSGKLHKHFIFSDLKFGSYGAKMLASALIADGYNLGYSAELKSKKPSNKSSKKTPKPAKNKSKKNYETIQLHSNEKLRKTENNNFYMLSSAGVYDQNITVKMKKEMLQRFNQRPDNVHGELIRFIILDSGFKEGIDLFDVKYVHVFEPSIYLADQKQVIGRSTRTCGQKGIEFHPVYGWPLHVFIYDLSIPEKIQGSLLDSKTAIDLYLKSLNLDIRLLNFTSDLEEKTILGSVDYELNKNVHSFSIPAFSEKTGGSPELEEELTYDLPPVDHDTMSEIIKDNYSEFAWDAVKMENLCEDKNKGGSGGQLITYTPTQDFIRHYFHPLSLVKGMLLYHSVGTGKTCSAIAAATTNFEHNGYTILWVTRTTLKNDIWKNMFDQVCNERIRNQIQHLGLDVPTDQNQRMRLLSKAWSIRPMSYKQFSNLILKQNTIYDKLTKINGKQDPLRKTLLIIDEAHKLYGGDDLSSIEKPDMDALKKALHYSYQYSGEDSVRLLLMTATPITKDPMELIKLINLCKPSQYQIPNDFDVFSAQYLDEEGKFTSQGTKKYFDDIAGHVSYLNREKDARQFAQPMIHHIHTSIVKNIADVEKFDKKIMRDVLEVNAEEYKKQIKEETKKLEGELGEVNKSKFTYLKKELCEDLSGKAKSQCTKVVNKNVVEIVKEVKQHVKEIKQKIKDVNLLMKEKKRVKNVALKDIKHNINKYMSEYNKYKETLLYELKDKCSKRIKNEKQLNEYIREHPSIQKYNEEIESYNKQIDNLNDNIKVLADNYKIRMKQLKELLKTDLTDVERNVVNMVIREERKDYKHTRRVTAKENKHIVKSWKKDISELLKERTKQKKDILKDIKKSLKEEKTQAKTYKKEMKKLRKTMKVTGEVKHELLKDLVDKYKSKMKDDLVEIKAAEAEKERLKQEAKEQKKKEKEEEKAMKKIAKEEEKTAKKLEKEKEKVAKKLEKEREKAAIRETKKLAKEQEKLAKMAARKTKKNQK